MEDRKHFFFLNVGHFLDHLFMLIFATVAALVLAREWGLSYAELIPYATPGLVAGLFSLPAGWLADRWSREGMMVVFHRHRPRAAPPAKRKTRSRSPPGCLSSACSRRFITRSAWR